MSNFKAIEQLVMEILHLKDSRDTSSVVMDAVVSSGVRRVSNFNTNVPLGDIYPPVELYCNVLGIDNNMPL